jgi:hypothetical protein
MARTLVSVAVASLPAWLLRSIVNEIMYISGAVLVQEPFESAVPLFGGVRPPPAVADRSYEAEGQRQLLPPEVPESPLHGALARAPQDHERAAEQGPAQKVQRSVAADQAKGPKDTPSPSGDRFCQEPSLSTPKPH